MTDSTCTPSAELTVVAFGGDGRRALHSGEASFLQRWPATYFGRFTAMLTVCLPILVIVQLAWPMFNWRTALILASFLLLGAVDSRRQLLLSYPVVFVSTGVLLGRLLQDGTVDAFYYWVTSFALALYAALLACTRYSPANDRRVPTSAWLEPGDGTQVPMDLVEFECKHAEHDVHTIAVARGECVQLVGTYRLTHNGLPRQVVLLAALESPGGAWYVPNERTMLEPS